jgi:hypothetical protein
VWGGGRVFEKKAEKMGHLTPKHGTEKSVDLEKTGGVLRG